MLLVRELEEGDNKPGHALGARDNFPYPFFSNRRASDAASCCRTRAISTIDCNGPSRKDCMAAVSGRPHERGQCNSLFLQNHPRFGRGHSLQFLSPLIAPMTVSRPRISIIFARMANQFIQAVRNFPKYLFDRGPS